MVPAMRPKKDKRAKTPAKRARKVTQKPTPPLPPPPEGTREQWYPLANDPGLHAAGVEIGARVTFQGDKPPKMRIVFRAGGKEASVECVHVAVYAGSLESLPPEAELARSSERYPIQLAPEEHFFALNSYVAGIAEVGLGAMFAAAREAGGDFPVGFNALMQHQVIEVLCPLVPIALIDILSKDWDVIADQTREFPRGLTQIIASIIWNPVMDPDLDQEIYFEDKASGLYIRKNYANILQTILNFISPLAFFAKNEDLRDLLRVPSIFNLIKELFRNGEEESQLQALLNSSMIHCPGCGRKWYSETYFVKCKNCKAFVCAYCHDKCSECGGDLCKKCETKYKNNYDNGILCKHCVEQLSCGHVHFTHGNQDDDEDVDFDDKDDDEEDDDDDPIGIFRDKDDGAVIMCDEPGCKKLLCEYCAEQCECGLTFCETDAKNHIGECYICQGKVCLGLENPGPRKGECEICGQIVCEKHSVVFYDIWKACHSCVGKCDICGEYVWPYDRHCSLRTCHYCGKKMCAYDSGSSCASKHTFECEECDILFCDECEDKHLKDYPEHDFIIAYCGNCHVIDLLCLL